MPARQGALSRRAPQPQATALGALAGPAAAGVTPTLDRRSQTAFGRPRAAWARDAKSARSAGSWITRSGIGGKANEA